MKGIKTLKTRFLSAFLSTAMVVTGTLVPQAEWKVNAEESTKIDLQNTAKVITSSGISESAKDNIVDGRKDTYWESWERGKSTYMPQEVILELDDYYDLDRIVVIRDDIGNEQSGTPSYDYNTGGGNGRLQRYRVCVSEDGVNYYPEYEQYPSTVSGNFPDNNADSNYYANPKEAEGTVTFNNDKTNGEYQIESTFEFSKLEGVDTSSVKYVKVELLEAARYYDTAYVDYVRLAELELYSKVEEKTETDKSELRNLVSSFDELVSSDYTKDSWEAFGAVLLAAKEVIADEKATQENVTNAIAALTEARNSLMLKTTVAAPVASPEAGEVEAGTPVTLAATKGAMIYYTTGEGTPDQEYTEAIVINENMTIKAKAVKEDCKDSEIAEFVYTVPAAETPEISYTVVFAGEGITIPTQTIKAGSMAVKPEDPVRDGYEFKGWKLNDADYDFHSAVNTDITLTAVWEEKVPAVTADKTALQSLVNDNKDKQQGSYTDDSWKAFTDALSAAQAMLAKENAVQDELDAAKTVLENAVTGLTEKIPEQPPVTPEEPDDSKWGEILLEDRTGLTEVPDGIWTAGIEDLTYNGTKQTQEFRVYDGNKMLTLGKDYTASIKNNQNACIDMTSKKAPQVVLKMKGDYKGTKTIAFRILPVEISDESVVADDIYVTYNGKKQTPVPAITWNGKKLTAKDFYVKEYKAGDADFVGSEAGSETSTLTIMGQGNFTGETTIHYTIGAKGKKFAMNKMKVKGVSKSVNWSGSQAETEEGIILTGFKVMNGKTRLIEGIDYNVTYENNKAAGTATMILTGTGNANEAGISYHGVKRVNFTIKGSAMSGVKVNGLAKAGYPYTGEEIEPMETEGVSVTLKKVPVAKEAYEVSYEKNVEKGTASIILTGKPEMGYTGSKKVSFKITPANLDNSYTVTLSGNDVKEDTTAVYTAGGVTPQVEVTGKAGNELVAGLDYTVSYKNNKAVAKADAVKAPTAVIKGKGNYAKSIELKFTIEKKETTEDDGMLNVSAKDKSLTSKAGSWKQNFKVLDVNGKALTAKDYDKAAVYFKVTDGEEINLNENPNTDIKAGDVIKIVVTLKGANYSGTASGTYRIIDKNKDISKAVFKIAAKEYTGEEIELTKEDITQASLKKAPLTLEEQYEIAGYEKNINKGTAKVIFRGIGDFGGEKTVNFKINGRDAANHWWSNLVETLFR